MKIDIIQDLSDIKKYSYSKLSSIWQCPYAYYLTYVKGVRGQSNGFADVGLAAHQVLEEYFNGTILNFQLTDRLDEVWEERVKNGVFLNFENGYKKDLTEQYREQCYAYFNNFDGLKSHIPILVEKEFLMLVQLEEKTILLSGIIDLYTHNEDKKTYIIDHKSKSQFKTQEEIDEYAKQLYLYSLYIKHKYGEYPNELWFNQFRLNHIEKIKFDKKTLDKTLQWVYNSVNKIEQETAYLPKQDPFFCQNLCNFRNICEYK